MDKGRNEGYLLQLHKCIVIVVLKEISVIGINMLLVHHYYQYHQLNPAAHSRFNTKQCFGSNPTLLLLGNQLSNNKPTTWVTFSINPRRNHPELNLTSTGHHDNPMSTLNNGGEGAGNYPKEEEEGETTNSFWGAVSLIIGTAVGPGMLGLPAATIKSGTIPSTIAILLSWVYVISSILLVAELSFAIMEEDGVAEVSFTTIATKALGNHCGAFVSLVYALLSFSLLVACISGIAAIVSRCFPLINHVLAHALFPSCVGLILCFSPFKVIDATNRFLCSIMLFSITSLVLIGVFVARQSILNSFARASWSISSVMPAIPITVLTLGFHVITPFICKIAGNTVHDARKAIMIGGFVPLIMVLSWNLIVLGLAGTNNVAPSSSSLTDPISLLLSVNSSALSAVQVFAFSALATSLIGYAVSFPKQVFDTMEIFFGKSLSNLNQPPNCYLETEVGKVGFVTYSPREHEHDDLGGVGLGGKISYGGLSCIPISKEASSVSSDGYMVPIVLTVSVLIASFSRSTFSRALDFAGIYANCFLFGILPPLMTFIYQMRKKLRRDILPGGDYALLMLFGTAVVLGIWH